MYNTAQDNKHSIGQIAAYKKQLKNKRLRIVEQAVG